MASIQDNRYYGYTAPKRPVIRKLGTIKCDVVESTPVVFQDRLYRMEYYRGAELNEANTAGGTYMHFFDVQTNSELPPFAYGHHFGAAFADGDTMLVCALNGNVGESDTIDIFASKDLESWELISSVVYEGKPCFNSNICKKDGVYTLLFESAYPVGFTFHFAQSTDLKKWTILSEDRIFQKNRYAGGPAVYTLENDPYYYVLYLEANNETYTNCIARSKDLTEWEYSPLNPVLMYEPDEDKKIANPFLTPHERERIARAWDKNNSDMECCEFLGRTIINYSWGCQYGVEFLAEACFEGTMAELLQGFFDKT